MRRPPDEAGGLFSGHEFVCAVIETGVCRDHGRAQSRYVDVAVMEPVYPKQLMSPVDFGRLEHDVSELLSNLSLKFRIIEGRDALPR